MILIALLALMIGGLALWAADKANRALKEERKRSEKQRAAMIAYVDTTADSLRKEIGRAVAEAKEEFARNGEWEKAVMQAAEEKIAEAVAEICNKMSSAYFENDFNANLGNILNFDPYDSIRAQREKERMGERR